MKKESVQPRRLCINNNSQRQRAESFRQSICVYHRCTNQMVVSLDLAVDPRQDEYTQKTSPLQSEITEPSPPPSPQTTRHIIPSPPNLKKLSPHLNLARCISNVETRRTVARDWPLLRPLTPTFIMRSSSIRVVRLFPEPWDLELDCRFMPFCLVAMVRGILGTRKLNCVIQQLR